MTWAISFPRDVPQREYNNVSPKFNQCEWFWAQHGYDFTVVQEGRTAVCAGKFSSSRGGTGAGKGVMQSVGKCGMFEKNVNDRTGDPREEKGCTERHRHTSRKNTSIIFAFEILLISSVLASEPARPQPTLTIMIFCFSSADRPAQNGGQSERHAERYNLHAQNPKSKSNNSSNTNKRRNVIRFFIVPHPVR